MDNMTEPKIVTVRDNGEFVIQLNLGGSKDCLSREQATPLRDAITKALEEG